MIYQITKRLFDFSVSTIAFILLLPVFLVVTVVLFFANSGKPFFFQDRPGKNERVFRLIKFKTMNDKTDDEGNLLPFDQRVTKIGDFIRSHSLDEIPQLLNVIRGDMSLVGPRPLLVDYLSRYNEFQRQRHLVRPGITGWAQVHGRNAISWTKKFEHDVWYVENCSFLLDLKILLMTVKKVLAKEDINASSTLNMPEFMGSEGE